MDQMRLRIREEMARRISHGKITRRVLAEFGNSWEFFTVEYGIKRNGFSSRQSQ